MGTINNLPDPNQNAINALNQISLQLAQLTKVMSQVFPQSISTALTATSGSVSVKNYVGFLSVSDPLTGGTVKVGFYND